MHVEEGLRGRSGVKILVETRPLPKSQQNLEELPYITDLTIS